MIVLAHVFAQGYMDSCVNVMHGRGVIPAGGIDFRPVENINTSSTDTGPCSVKEAVIRYICIHVKSDFIILSEQYFTSQTSTVHNIVSPETECQVFCCPPVAPCYTELWYEELFKFCSSQPLVHVTQHWSHYTGMLAKGIKKV